MRKGRNKSLIEERDRRLFERFYFWTEVKRIRFDDAIATLSHDEFFLSEARIMAIVRRMLSEGATVNGSSIPPQRHGGFRVIATRLKRESKASELSLFPE